MYEYKEAFFRSNIKVYGNLLSVENKIIYLPLNITLIESYNSLTETMDNIVVFIKQYKKDTYDMVFIVNKKTGEIKQA